MCVCLVVVAIVVACAHLVVVDHGVNVGVVQLVASMWSLCVSSMCLSCVWLLVGLYGC